MRDFKVTRLLPERCDSDVQIFAEILLPEIYSFTITGEELRRLPEEIREFILLNTHGDKFGRWLTAALGFLEDDKLTVTLQAPHFNELVDRIEAKNEEIYAFLGRS
jgi:hypothetical protein